jgi:hypothetical protein
MTVGWGNKTNIPNQFVCGTYCKENTRDALLVVGNGGSNLFKENAFEVYTDGRAKVYGMPTEENDVVRLQDIATADKDGLMSKTDKANLDTLTELLKDDDANTTVETIREVLTVFSEYPEETTVVNALAAKQDKITDTNKLDVDKIDGLDKFIDKESDQTITGCKTFSNTLTLNSELNIFNSASSEPPTIYGKDGITVIPSSSSDSVQLTFPTHISRDSNGEVRSSTIITDYDLTQKLYGKGHHLGFLGASSASELLEQLSNSTISVGDYWVYIGDNTLELPADYDVAPKVVERGDYVVALKNNITDVDSVNWQPCKSDTYEDFITSINGYAKKTDLSEYVDLTSNQTITGTKTFSGPIFNEGALNNYGPVQIFSNKESAPLQITSSYIRDCTSDYYYTFPDASGKFATQEWVQANTCDEAALETYLTNNNYVQAPDSPLYIATVISAGDTYWELNAINGNGETYTGDKILCGWNENGVPLTIRDIYATKERTIPNSTIDTEFFNSLY